MATRPAVVTVVADAFRDAVLAGVNMSRAVEVLEPLRVFAEEGVDLYKLSDSVDAAAGKVAMEALKPIVDAVRERVIGLLCDTLTASVDDAFDRDRQDGWRTWLRCYAESLENFREPVSRHLLDMDLPIPFPDPPGRGGLTRWTEDAYARRWLSAYPVVAYLLEHADVDRATRVDLLVTAGEIQLHWGHHPDAAKLMFDAAEAEGPDESRTWEGVGGFLLEQDDVDGAERAFGRAVELGPERSGTGYRGLGECALHRGDLESAEERYLNGMSAVPYDLDCYRALIQLYGRPELFEHRKGRLTMLAARAVAVAPSFRYEVEVDLGLAHQENGDAETAGRHLRTAVELHPDWSWARLELSKLYLAKDELDSAREQCARMISDDPQYGLAHWQFGRINERLTEWDRAIRNYERALDLLPALRANLLADIAFTHLAAGRDESAATVALGGLEAEPDNKQLLDAVYEIALKRLTDQGDAAAAERLLYQVRQLNSDDFEATYQQRRGHLYYDAKKYPEAVAAYERALASDSRAEYQVDMARARRMQRDWAHAKEALEQARMLGGDDKLCRTELAAVCNEEANEEYDAGRYTEAAEGYRQATELAPDDAVLHTNLAGALELGMRPGGRAKALHEAVKAMLQAEKVSDDAGSKARRSRLERLAAVVQRYGELAATPLTDPSVQINVADDLVPLVNPAQHGADFLRGLVPAARERAREQSGLSLPGFSFRGDPELPPGGYVIRVENIEVARAAVVVGWECVLGPAELTATAGSAGEGVERLPFGWNPLTGGPGCWVRPEYADDGGGGIRRRLTATEFLLEHAVDVVGREAWRWFGTETAEGWSAEVCRAVEGNGAAEETWSLSAAARPSQIRFAARLLRNLVRDGVVLSEPARVAGLLAEAVGRAGEPVDAVRWLRRALRDKLPGNAPEVTRVPVPAWAVDAMGGAPSADPGRPDSGRGEPWLDPVQEQRLTAELRRLVGTNERIAFVTSHPAARPYLERLIEGGIGAPWGAVAGVLETTEVCEATDEADEADEADEGELFRGNDERGERS